VQKSTFLSVQISAVITFYPSFQYKENVSQYTIYWRAV